MKIFIRCLSLVLLACMSFTSAFASGAVTATVSFDPSNGAVIVAGSSSGSTIIKALPYGTEPSLSESNLYTHFDQISGSELPYTFYMSDSAAYGKYSVYVVSSSSAADTFMYYDPAAADSVIPTLNGTASGALLANAISTNAATLGIDMDDSFTLTNYAAASDILFAAFKPFVNSGDFYNKFNACLAMAAMKGANKAGVEAMLSGYASQLGITSASAYGTLGADIASELCSLLSSMDFSAQYRALANEGKTVSFANLFARTAALSAARLAQNWASLQKVFETDYVSVLGEITSANPSFTAANATNVYMMLITKQPYTSLADLKSKFDSSVAASPVINTDIYTPAPSAKPGGYVSTPSGYTNPADQYEETSGTQTPMEDSAPVVQTSITTPELNSEKTSYWDVSAESWENEAVTTLGANGIISGYEDGSYRSANSITRAEFAKLIVAAFAIKAAPASFNDVSESDWFYPYVSVAAGSGIVNGYDGSFNPNSLITREDAAVIIYRTAALAGTNYNGSADFADILDVSVYAMPAVRGLGNAGIINGDTASRFNPKSNLTRAEAAQLLYNFIDALAQ